jgi:RimJ/RimL family protein N-acetyltransferase
LTATSRIATDRLELVPLALDDAAEMVGVLADPNLYAFIGGAPPTLAELERQFPKWAHGSPRSGEDWHNWVIRLRDDGTAIGHLQATVVGDGRQADVAWLIGTPWQGRGYASEAARAMTAWLEATGVPTITAHIEAGHEASGRVAAAAGLEPTSVIEGGEVVWRRQDANSRTVSRRARPSATPR